MARVGGLAALVLGDADGFRPGSTFEYGGLTWERSYLVRNALRQASAPGYRLVEADPRAPGPPGALARPNHPAHVGCDGARAHRLLWVVATSGERLVAVVVDDEWHDLAAVPNTAREG
ncbi:MAG TPA: hypothetical protein VD838_08095 [Anaeromyxobacteraceae bacterium]|nr:hypothetical protein [Anaeromyxobacteraceae bacterium]